MSTLFDPPPTSCPDCGRALDENYQCGWCIAGAAPTQVRHDAMDTSVKAAALPNQPSNKQTIYVLLHDNPGGLTDMEIEGITGMPHQTASASRRALVLAGLAEDSGERRKNIRGNDAAVWRLVSPDRKDTHDSAPASDDRPTDPVPSYAGGFPHFHVWSRTESEYGTHLCRECGSFSYLAEED